MNAFYPFISAVFYCFTTINAKPSATEAIRNMILRDLWSSYKYRSLLFIIL